MRFFRQSRGYVVTTRARYHDLRGRRLGLATGLAGERRRSDGATFGVSLAGRYGHAHTPAGTHDMADAGPDPDASAQADLISSADIYGVSKSEPLGEPEPRTEHRSG
jgi:hypothetical protein